jgi:hypothetical protein
MGRRKELMSALDGNSNHPEFSIMDPDDLVTGIQNINESLFKYQKGGKKVNKLEFNNTVYNYSAHRCDSVHADSPQKGSSDFPGVTM